MDFTKMTQTELRQIGKEYEIKGAYKLNKEELLEKIKEYQVAQKLHPFLQELLKTVPTDMKRKVCKNCYEIGHSETSIHCCMNAEKNKEDIEHIKQYFLLQEIGSDNRVHFQTLSTQLNITIEHCKLLFREIPRIELVKRPFDLRKHIEEEKVPFISCKECSKQICTIQPNTARLWKGDTMCDTCYSQYAEEREKTWEKVAQYRPIVCALCLSEKRHKDERYQFDHLNMFDKENIIYSLVVTGVNLEDIHKEIDKCQVLCISCHHIVTFMERKIGFTKLKRQYTSDYLKQDENKELNDMLKENYREVMTPQYEVMRQLMKEKRETI
jgi:hypothetical protein